MSLSHDKLEYIHKAPLCRVHILKGIKLRFSLNFQISKLDLRFSERCNIECNLCHFKQEFSLILQELRQSGIVKNFKTGCLFTKTFKDSFSGKDFVDWAIKNKNVEKEKAIEMGQELISRKFGFGIHKTEEFKYEPDAIYQLGSGLGSSALNQGNLLRGIGNYSGVA